MEQKQDPVINEKLCVLLVERALSKLPPGTENILGIFDLRGFGTENGDFQFLKFLVSELNIRNRKKVHSNNFANSV